MIIEGSGRINGYPAKKKYLTSKLLRQNIN